MYSQVKNVKKHQIQSGYSSPVKNARNIATLPAVPVSYTSTPKKILINNQFIVQKKNNIIPGIYLDINSVLNDKQGLNKTPDSIGSMALCNPDHPKASSGNAQTVGICYNNPVQMKKVIKGEERFNNKGKMEINFEERTKGSSAGVYGTVAFTPQPVDGTVAEKIDLVQIASMTSNNKGQAIFRNEGHLNVEPDKEQETSGSPQVKNMWRVNDKFHMDLLGTESVPRGDSKMPVIEEAYNAERREKWKDPLDTVTMSNNEKVLDEFSIMHAWKSTKEIPDSTTRKISQSPGYNDGKENTKETELFDFPCSPEPVIASFHTTVDADGKPWGTVQWGFKSIKNYGDEMEIESVQGPQFTEEQTTEMKEARRNFNAIMANPTSWTSPEAYDEVKKLLKKKDTFEEGQDKLIYMAEEMRKTINKIMENDTDKLILKNFILPHLNMLQKVLDELYHEFGENDKLYQELVILYNKTMEKIS